MMTRQGIGSPLWAAPEIEVNPSYSKPSDAYSYGMVLYELYSGMLPYHEYKKVELKVFYDSHKS